MSYCRFGPDSDVYVYGGCDSIVCCACHLGPYDEASGYACNEFTGNNKEMLAHLVEHVKAGHKVPERAIQWLSREIDYQNSGWWRRMWISILSKLELKIMWGWEYEMKFDGAIYDDEFEEPIVENKQNES